MSRASSFVKRSSRSKPCSLPTRKFEQKRWYAALDGITYLPLRTPALLWWSLISLSSALLGSCRVAGNGTSDNSWLTRMSAVPFPLILLKEIPSGIASNM